MTDEFAPIDPGILQEAQADAEALKHVEGPELIELSQLLFSRHDASADIDFAQLAEEEYWAWLVAPIRARFIKLEERLKAMQDGIERAVGILNESGFADSTGSGGPDGHMAHEDVSSALAELNKVL